MTAPDLAAARDLCAYVDASPSPYHACSEAERRLTQAGFRALEEPAAWGAEPGRFYVRRGGSLAAWIQAGGADSSRPFRLLGAHTDSPNLRIKPRPDTGRAGYRQLGVEIYGGVLLNSWLDRDLGLSGQVMLEADGGVERVEFLVDRPVLRVPQLAIHLHREINKEGLRLNAQNHMAPVFGLGTPIEGHFREFLARELGVEPRRVLAWEAMTHDLMPSCLIGPEEELLSAPRLDNLCSAWAATTALLEAAESELPADPVITLFDHEEVGSTSRAGADGPLLGALLERVVLARGGSREDYHRAVADSLCVSSDMAHATHPNYAEKHDRDHDVRMNAGPVIKQNSNQRYATESETEARFQLACERAGVPFQKWVMRSDLACGSTIGPITAANLGMRVVDVGCPQLAMHSARELCGSHDPGYMVAAMVESLRG